MTSQQRWWVRVAAVALTAAVATPGVARGDVFRRTVEVDLPANVAPRLARLDAEAAAKKALAAAYVEDRLSRTLIEARGEQVRQALEPLADLVTDFKVLANDDIGSNRARISCEGDIDSAGIVLRLVTARVLTFGQTPPRVLLTPAPGTRADVVQALRARLTDTLGAAGIRLVAAEVSSAAAPVRGRTDVSQAVDAAVETRADFVALVSYAAAAAPSPVGGAVLDATIQYTVTRVHDSGIVAEQTFSGRGSGASADLATRMILDTLGPKVARGLAGRLAEGIFGGGSVIDPALPARSLMVNVYARPDAAATNALVELLRDAGHTVVLGTARVGAGGTATQTPADQLIIESPVTIEELYDTFATAKFGNGKMLRASVFEYGADYIGLEIVDRTPPKNPPVTQRPVTRTAVTDPSVSASGGVALGGRVGSAATSTKAAAAAPPLEFRLSAAFNAPARRR
jgi:hypothetical protein